MSIDTYNPEKWTCSSNEALKIALAGENGALLFHPTFTYPIFGDSEQIFGYNGLELNLAFNATSMLPLLGMKYKEKLSNAATDIEDPQKRLSEFLPASVIINDESRWAEECEKEEESFKIPGEKIHEYTRKDESGEVLEFEVYKCNLSDGAMKELHLRVQILVLLFIEAGSYIDENDENWHYFVIFQKPKKDRKHPKFIGFTTAYSYWKYPGHELHDKSDTLELLLRQKISQFIILPPYQHQHHGAELYTVFVEDCLKNDSIVEIVVEDPSEQFDDLRDRCDLTRLAKDGFFKITNFPEIPVPEDFIQEQQEKYKMEKRQFERCLEMGLLHLSSAKKSVRLQIKKRLYLKNKDILDGLEDAEKKDKLQSAYERLVEDYERIYSKVKFVAKRGPEDAPTASKKAKVDA